MGDRDITASYTPEIAQGVAPFVLKMHALLNQSLPFISWSDDGKYFTVSDQDKLMAYVVANKYMSTSNFSSLVRQLNMYGFTKTSDTTLTFRHLDFQRDRTELLYKVIRRTGDLSLTSRKIISSLRAQVATLTQRIRELESASMCTCQYTRTSFETDSPFVSSCDDDEDNDDSFDFLLLP